VPEGDGDPTRFEGARPGRIVGEESALSRDALELLGACGDVGKVGREERVAVTLREAEREAALLLERVLRGVDVVRPCDAVAAEGVLDGVVRGDSEGNAVRGRRA